MVDKQPSGYHTADPEFRSLPLSSASCGLLTLSLCGGVLFLFGLGLGCIHACMRECAVGPVREVGLCACACAGEGDGGWERKRTTGAIDETLCLPVCHMVNAHTAAHKHWCSPPRTHAQHTPSWCHLWPVPSLLIRSHAVRKGKNVNPQTLYRVEEEVTQPPHCEGARYAAVVQL